MLVPIFIHIDASWNSRKQQLGVCFFGRQPPTPFLFFSILSILDACSFCHIKFSFLELMQLVALIFFYNYYERLVETLVWWIFICRIFSGALIILTAMASRWMATNNNNFWLYLTRANKRDPQFSNLFFVQVKNAGNSFLMLVFVLWK